MQHILFLSVSCSCSRSECEENTKKIREYAGTYLYLSKLIYADLLKDRLQIFVLILSNLSELTNFYSP